MMAATLPGAESAKKRKSPLVVLLAEDWLYRRAIFLVFVSFAHVVATVLLNLLRVEWNDASTWLHVVLVVLAGWVSFDLIRIVRERRMEDGLWPD